MNIPSYFLSSMNCRAIFPHFRWRESPYDLNSNQQCSSVILNAEEILKKCQMISNFCLIDWNFYWQIVMVFGCMVAVEHLMSSFLLLVCLMSDLIITFQHINSTDDQRRYTVLEFKSFKNKIEIEYSWLICRWFEFLHSSCTDEPHTAISQLIKNSTYGW